MVGVVGCSSIALLACSGGEVATITASDAGLDVSSAPDTSTGTDASEASAPDAGFSMKSVSGLVLWLDANKGVTTSGANLVDRWADQSGHGSDAVQANATYKPLARATGLAGMPSVHVEAGTHLTVADSPVLEVGVGDFYIGIVFSYDGVGALGYGLVFSKQDANYPFAGPGIFANFVLPMPSTTIGGQVDIATGHYVTTTTTSLNDGKARLFGFARKVGLISVRLDGQEQATAATGNINGDAPGRPIFIGAQLQPQGVIQELKGDIAEIVMVTNPQQKDIPAIEAYLMTKYSL